MSKEGLRIIRPSDRLSQASLEFEFNDEYIKGRTRLLHYGLKGIFHVLLFSFAEEIKSEEELKIFIDEFGIRFGAESDSPFVFNGKLFENNGLLIPKGSGVKVKGFYRDYFNIYPGYPDLQTKEWREEHNLMSSVCAREWNASDFFNKDLLNTGVRFGNGLWLNAVEGFNTYYKSELSKKAAENFQLLIDYYSAVVGNPLFSRSL